jgi:tetratricopeptide (TPR) repeat protein
MRKPLETKIDAAVGREICLRDGGIPAMLTGRVEKFGSTYTLSAQLVDPIRGLTLASLSEDDPADSQMAGAVHRLSNRVRQRLGEQPSLIRQHEANLEKVTTPSLKALQLYTNADRLIRENKQAAAAQLLKQAIDEDPGFASAHILLAWAVWNQNTQAKEYVPYAKRAFELSEQTSERERYFIQGSYYQILNQVKEAIASYEALLRLYPDHFWADNNLAPLYFSAGRVRDFQELLIHRAELRPGSFDFNSRAGVAELQMGQFAAAKRYLARAQALITPETQESEPVDFVTLAFVPVWELMRNGDVDRALGEADRLAGAFESRPAGTQSGWLGTPDPEARSYFAKLEGNQYFKLGKLRSAYDWYQKEVESVGAAGGSPLDLSNVARAEGNPEAARRALLHFLTLRPNPDPRYPEFQMTAKLCAELGLLSELKKMILRAEKNVSAAQHKMQFAKGALALAEGHQAEAVLYLRGTVDDLRGLQFTNMAEDLLATALEKQGDFAGAIDALKPMELNDEGGPDLDARYHLARLYRKVGNKAEAQSIETDLVKRLKYADPDHPILRELEKRRHTQ